MPNNFTLESKDIERFTKYLASNPDVMLRYARIMLDKSTLTIERDAKQLAPSNEGTLRKGIMSTIYPLYSKVISTAEYSIYVHEGTRPHFPPIQPGSSLDRWANKKGIPTFMVAKAIAQKGTKAQPFMNDAMEKNQSTINEYAKEMLDNTATELANA
jgi:HK97 gp10 family phage protein